MILGSALKRLPVWFWACLLLLCTLQGRVHASDASAPLEMEVAVADQQERMTMVVTLRNRDLSETITQIVVQVRAGQYTYEQQSIAQLETGQSKAVVFDVPRGRGTNYVFISYVWKNLPQSVVRVAPALAPAPAILSWSTVAPSLMALAGVVVGAWMTSALSNRRERERARFEWNRMMFEKYEKYYLEFLAAWGGAASAVVLERHFEMLQAHALVPTDVVTAYHRTLALLLDETHSSDTKQKSCNELRRLFDDVLGISRSVG